MARWKRGHITPAQVIMAGFGAIILAGTLLLCLPFATASGRSAGLETALFTATSATCVTGLILQDTATFWSPFGQAVILLLIQIGGLGVVTMALALSILTGRKIGLRQRWVMQESISAPQVGGIVRQTRFILRAAACVEGAGALLLSLYFIPRLGFWRGLWYAVFHSVSAFCNAGFDLMGAVTGPFTSMTAGVADGYLNVVLCLLIVLGGLGFLVWRDLLDCRGDFRRLRLHAKLVLCVTGALLLLGFVFFYFYEFRCRQWREMDGATRFWAAVFQSVTPRTAGFNTVDQAALSEPGQLVTLLLMLTGGSPGSTAGGMKTTTLAVLLLGTWAVFHHQESPECFGRRLPGEVLRSALALLMLYLLLVFAGGTAICMLEGVPLMPALFEAASAIGTVGLSQGLTPLLGTPSRLILIFLMYLGRVGGLTMMYAMSAGRPGHFRLPQERVTVG